MYELAKRVMGNLVLLLSQPMGFYPNSQHVPQAPPPHSVPCSPVGVFLGLTQGERFLLPSWSQVIFPLLLSGGSLGPLSNLMSKLILTC